MSEELICSDHPIRHSTEKQSLVTLIGLGALLLIIELYIFGAHRHNRFYSLLIWLTISGIPFVFAVWWTFQRKKFPANTLLTILIGAALFRFVLVPLDPPRLSTDIYRYIWDGRLQGAGMNPYLYLPVDPRLAGLRDDSIYPNINRKEYAHTIYPPVAQAFFFLVTRATQSVPGFKGVLVLIDLVTVGLVAATLRAIGQPAERVIAYAWHPLPIFEFGGSGHIDALMICFVALALFARVHQKFGIAGFALGAATLVKFIPLILLPAIYRRWDKKLPIAFAITLFVCYLPYVLGAGTGVLGFLSQYANEEGLQSGGRYYLLLLIDYLLEWCGVVHDLPPAIFMSIALAVLGAIAIWALYRQPSLGRENHETPWIFSAFFLALGFSALLSPYYPWYYSWLALFLCFVPSSATLALTLISWPLYRSLFEQSADDLFRFQSRVFLPFFALLVLMWIMRKRGSRTARKS
ncbi:MAG TPA: glycosyltransferase 87 family protein [Chthoniobacterales bacterium]|nr:glycosyltransferase 87 family protein [Chthoniobacterales bacterium]